MSRNEHGISFWDVREYADAVGYCFHCIVHYELHLPPRSSLGVAWQVRCVARWYDARGGVTRERGEGAPWPSSEAKTFAGLEFLLLARLERKIEEEEMEAQLAAAKQQRLF